MYKYVYIIKSNEIFDFSILYSRNKMYIVSFVTATNTGQTILHTE